MSCNNKYIYSKNKIKINKDRRTKNQEYFVFYYTLDIFWILLIIIGNPEQYIRFPALSVSNNIMLHTNFNSQYNGLKTNLSSS